MTDFPSPPNLRSNGVQRLLAAAFLALTLSSCSVGEDYQRPALNMPEQFTQSSTGDDINPDWWNGFDSDGLNALMDAASKGNLDLAAAAARIHQADAQRRIAGASLLPTLDLGADSGRARNPSSASQSARYATSYKTSLSASYEIDFWGANRARALSAEADAAAKRFDWQTVIMTTQSSVAETYFAFLGDRDRLMVAEKNLTNAREVLAAIRDRQRLGTATERDVAKQDNIVAAAAANIPPLEQSLEQNINALRILTGDIAFDVAINDDRLADIGVPAIAPGLPSALLERRPDVKSAEYALIAANANLTVARAALFPSIGLTGQYGFESLELSDLLSQKSLLWSIASNLTQPIFKGGALRGDIELKEGRYEELLANYRKAVIEALIDVENALIAIRRGHELEIAKQNLVASAQRSHNMSLEQFRAGITDIIDLLDAQNSLYVANDSLVQARQSHLQAIVSLTRALGGGWDGATPAPEEKTK